MEKLRQSDLRAVLGFVSDCYTLREVQPFEAFVRNLVTALPRLIPAEHVTYNDMEPGKSKSHNCVNTPELATAAAAAGWEQHMNEHPVLAYAVRTGNCGATKISDFWSQRQLHDRGLYSDFYRSFGIEDALCANLTSEPGHVVGIGLHRSRRFSNREQLIFDLVRPHIVQAWQNAKLVSRTRQELELLPEAMENVGLGVIVCGPEGRIQFATAVGQRYVADYFGISQASDHRLPDELLRWVRFEHEQSAKEDVPQVRLPLVREKAARRLIIRLLSNMGTNLLLLEEQESAPEVAISKKFGLTQREGEVLAWVAQGKTNTEIATILGITPLTAKKHLENILHKLGVENRTAAAALLVTVAPGSGKPLADADHG